MGFFLLFLIWDNGRPFPAVGLRDNASHYALRDNTFGITLSANGYRTNIPTGCRIGTGRFRGWDLFFVLKNIQVFMPNVSAQSSIIRI